jgi:hypothetical protein
MLCATARRAACHLRGLHQVSCALDAQPVVGLLRRWIARRARRARQISELMNNEVGPHRRDRLGQRTGIERVSRDWHDAERVQPPNLRRCTRRCGNLVLRIAQQGGQPPPDHTGRACQENSRSCASVRCSCSKKDDGFPFAIALYTA